MTKARFWYIAAIILIAAPFLPQAVYSQGLHSHGIGGGASDGLEWTQGFSLIVTDAADYKEAYAIENSIREAGGRIGLIFGDKVMLGWVPQELTRELVGKHNIVHASQRPLWNRTRDGLAMRQRFSKNELDGIRFFNHVARGHLAAERAAERPVSHQPKMKDSFEAPPVSYEDLRANLLANGIDEDALAAAGISIVQTDNGDLAQSPGNSDYMAGKATFNFFFVESVGGIDPNLYTWTGAHKTTIKNEIIAGLAWLASTAQNPSLYKVPLVFNIVFQTGFTNYEPILHAGPSQDTLWISQIMAAKGFGIGDKFARTLAFNAAQRIARNTNWATTSFIGYNPSPASTTFTDGYFAYAYLRGPYSQLLYRNNGWGVGNYDKVNAHETGHLFGASDEYGASGCSTARVANNVYNGNCINGNPNQIACLMNNNAFSMCGWTPGQLGWQNVTSLNLTTNRVDNGVSKLFFAPGEAIQFKTHFCVAGPKIGTMVHTVRMRYVANYLTSGLDTTGHVTDDSGWGSWTGVSPPTSTGRSCWVTWWNRNVPAPARYGQATLSVQMEIAGMGRQAKTKFSRFYVIDGAATTEPAPPAFSGPAMFAEPLNEGPFVAYVGEKID